MNEKIRGHQLLGYRKQYTTASRIQIGKREVKPNVLKNRSFSRAIKKLKYIGGP
jgi:ribosomal protein L10